MRRRRHDRQWMAVVLTAVLVVGLFLVPGVVPNRLRSLVGLGADRLLPAVAAPSEGGHQFLMATGDRPVRWDPCRPVRYEVNPEQARPEWVALVKAALNEVEDLTGLRFVYVGETDRRPGWDADFVPAQFGSGAPVLIAWATAKEVPRLAGEVAGLGGAATVSDEYGGKFLTRGGVTLDTDSFVLLAERRDGRAQQRAIVLHELGHLVGLAHVDDPRELMKGDGGVALTFGPGDHAGLAEAGRGPCG